jgi:serine protease Do
MLQLARILFFSLLSCLGVSAYLHEGVRQIAAGARFSMARVAFGQRSEAPSRPGRLTADLAAEDVLPGTDSSLLTVPIERIPFGMNVRGTSFPLGRDLWMTARHVATADCDRIVLVVNGTQIDAHIRYLDPNADIAVLETPIASATRLLMAKDAVGSDEIAFAYGYPHGSLGGTKNEFMAPARMRLIGRLSGVAPMLAWAEVDRYPDTLDSLKGISGGPMIDRNGDVVGVLVAASVRRGRSYTIAPEILRDIERAPRSFASTSRDMASAEAIAAPPSLHDAATAMETSARIAETYCVRS